MIIIIDLLEHYKKKMIAIELNFARHPAKQYDNKS